MRPDHFVSSLAASFAAREIDVRVENFPSAAEGLELQERLCDEMRDDCNLRVLVWQSPRALIVGRTDTRLPFFEAAAERLAADGWPVVMRRSGGTACPVSPGTVQVAFCQKAEAGTTIDTGYRRLAAAICNALVPFCLVATVDEVADAFCPGRFDIRIGDRKVAGLSQHWRETSSRRIATTAASLILDGDPRAFARAVNLFYECAGGGNRCRPDAVTSVCLALSGLHCDPMRASPAHLV